MFLSKCASIRSRVGGLNVVSCAVCAAGGGATGADGAGSTAVSSDEACPSGGGGGATVTVDGRDGVGADVGTTSSCGAGTGGSNSMANRSGRRLKGTWNV